MTRKLTFQGKGTSTFSCCENGHDVDQHTAAEGAPVIMRVRMRHQVLVISGRYCAAPESRWVIGVSFAADARDQAVPLSTIPMRFVPGSDRQSHVLEIDASDDVVVETVGGLSDAALSMTAPSDPKTSCPQPSDEHFEAIREQMSVAAKALNTANLHMALLDERNAAPDTPS